MPLAVPISTPASPGTDIARVGLQLELHVLAAARAPCRAAIRPALISEPGSQPSRDASQPQNSSPAHGRLGVVAHRHRADPAQLVAPLRRVEGRGHPLAPRRRAQPGQVDHVGLRGQLAGARRPPRRGSGSLTESTSTTWDRCSSASTASGCPCGDQVTVAMSVTTSGSTIVSSFSRWRGPRSSTMRSRASAISPGLVAASPSVVIATDASIVVRPVLHGAQDRARGVVAAHAARGG